MRPNLKLLTPYIVLIVLRLVVFFIFPYNLNGDAADYYNLAKGIFEGHGFTRCPFSPFPPTALRPPLLPYVYAWTLGFGLDEALTGLFLNIVLDILSALLAGKLLLNKGSKASWGPWVIALCPPLITYAAYPTTENISVFLGLMALLLWFHKKWFASGFFMGALSLCRSYLVLLPVFLVAWQIFNAVRAKKRKELAQLWMPMAAVILGAILLPALWVHRNWQELGEPVFSQKGAAGAQIFLGTRFLAFDWWREEHFGLVNNDPIYSQLFESSCMTDAEVAKLDRNLLGRAIDFVADHPIEAARNIIYKTFQLFTHWGQLFPYQRLPTVMLFFLDGFVVLLWAMLGVCLINSKTRKYFLNESYLKMSGLMMLYIVLVTLPFATDARYLLIPEVLLVLGILSLSSKERNDLKSVIKKWLAVRRGSH